MRSGRGSAQQSDAVVIGSGVNGLVAAVLLARAGWHVTVVERNPVPGGALATERLTRPGYLHDTFAAWHGTFVNGPAFGALRAELESLGLRYACATDVVAATVRRDGSSVLLHRDAGRTAQSLGVDGATYLGELDAARRAGPAIGRMMSHELTPAGALAAATLLVRSGGPSGLAWAARRAASSGRDWARSTFAGQDVDALVAPWLLHAGLSPDSATGGLTGLLMLDGLHRAGLPVPVGGSGRLVEALVAILEAHDGRVVTGADVTEVVVRRGRAVGVVAGDEFFPARRAVLASVTPGVLYSTLLRESRNVPERVRAAATGFRHGRAAMQVHVALSAPLDWRDSRLASVPLVHLADGSETVALACAQAEAGLLPSRPTVVVGQQHVLDPSRVPKGAASLWIQLQELPTVPRADASGAAVDGWTADVVERYVERVLAIVGEQAPNIAEVRLETVVLAPGDLERRNVNFVGGDPYGGATSLDQMLLWRPVPALGGHRTAVRRLWHIGASTHPGPGLGGLSGYSTARALTGRRRGLTRGG